MKIRLHAGARSELKEVLSYLDGQSAGLGEQFLAELRHTVEAITAYPEAAPVSTRGVRQKLMTRFPYVIAYVIQSRAIRILAISHQRRRPGYWLDRLPPQSTS
jgi:plasmid stabilization system protein ParE